MAKDRIAIVGSQASGKSVLLTVLTHRFQNASKDGFQICPSNQEAVKFCLKNWESLRNGMWPPPTPPTDKPSVYNWIMRFGKKEKYITTSDIAGEAWYSFIVGNVDKVDKAYLFSMQSLKEKWNAFSKTLSQKGIDTHVMTIKELLKSASCIFYLLDLSQIIDKECGYEEAMYLPVAMKEYMKSIGRKRIPINLILSKTDKYSYLLSEMHDWGKVVEKYIPWIPEFSIVIPVAAVAKTKDNNPAREFPSEGLDELCKCIWETKSSWSWNIIRLFNVFSLPFTNR